MLHRHVKRPELARCNSATAEWSSRSEEASSVLTGTPTTPGVDAAWVGAKSQIDRQPVGREQNTGRPLRVWHARQHLLAALTATKPQEDLSRTS